MTEDSRTYIMCGIDRHFSYDELVDVLNAEAATLPPETWRDGEWDVNDYIVEARQVGLITTVVDSEDDYPTDR